MGEKNFRLIKFWPTYFSIHQCLSSMYSNWSLLHEPFPVSMRFLLVQILWNLFFHSLRSVIHLFPLKSSPRKLLCWIGFSLVLNRLCLFLFSSIFFTDVVQKKESLTSISMFNPPWNKLVSWCSGFVHFSIPLFHRKYNTLRLSECILIRICWCLQQWWFLTSSRWIKMLLKIRNCIKNIFVLSIFANLWIYSTQQCTNNNSEQCQNSLVNKVVLFNKMRLNQTA